MTHIRTLMDYMIQIDEGRMKDIFTADEEGKSAKEIAKALKLPLGTVKKILGEQEEIKEFTDSQLDVLARQYQALAGKTISIDQANKLRKIFKGVPDRSLDALRRKKIPFLSGLALSRMVQKGMPVKEDTEEPKDTQNKSLKIKLDKEKDQDALEKQLVVAQGQINILKQKLENEKNKAVKPEPNKETGEVPLTVGIAHKLIKDKQEKEKDKKEVKENDDINWAGKLEEEKECPPGQYYCKVSGTCKPNSMKQETFAVQVTKKDGGKFIHGTYKTKAEAEKFVKWYKTGDLRTTKKIEVVKEMAKDDAYAIGMAQAKKSMKDEPPLEKKTITKGHEIAKKILAKEARYRVSGTMGYKGIGGNDGFEMVINANSERDAENKAEKELDKARAKRKIGPGGGGNIEDAEVISVERTSNRLQAPTQTHMYSHKPEGEKELEEGDQDDYAAAISFVMKKYGYKKPGSTSFSVNGQQAISLSDVQQILKKQPGGKAKIDQIDKEIEKKFKQYQKEELEEKYGKVSTYGE